MEKPVTAADANRKFSKLLRGVRGGQSYVVTSHGKAVAKIVPTGKNGGVARGTRASLVKRLRSQPVVRTGRWTREELKSPTNRMYVQSVVIGSKLYSLGSGIHDRSCSTSAMLRSLSASTNLDMTQAFIASLACVARESWLSFEGPDSRQVEGY